MVAQVYHSKRRKPGQAIGAGLVRIVPVGNACRGSIVRRVMIAACGTVERWANRGTAAVVRYVDQGSHRMHCLEWVLFIAFGMTEILCGKLRVRLSPPGCDQAIEPILWGAWEMRYRPEPGRN